jgi:hypothetical protein
MNERAKRFIAADVSPRILIFQVDQRRLTSAATFLS